MGHLVFKNMRKAGGFHRGTYKQEDSEAVHLEAPVFEALLHFICWDSLPNIEESFYIEGLSICSTDWYSLGRYSSSKQLCSAVPISRSSTQAAAMV